MIQLIRRIFKVFLKRAPPSFTVEIRRHQKRATVSANPGWVDTKLALSAFGGEPLRVAAVEIAKVEAGAAEPAGSRPCGRILPDLAEIELQNNRFAEALSSNATKIPSAKSPRVRNSKPMTVAG